MARARRIQAKTSLMAAEEIEIRPRSVVRSFSSARIRAKTPKAVSESATPMKMMNGTLLLSPEVEENSGKAKEVTTPIAKGRSIPPAAMEIAFLPVRRRDFRSISRPTRKRKRRRPRFARVSSTVRLFAGNNEFLYAVTLPRADGPRSIPPWAINLCLHLKLLLNRMFLNRFRSFS